MNLRQATLVLTIVGACASLWGAAAASDPNAGKPQATLDGLPLLFSDDFQTGKAEHWEPTDPKAWRVVAQGENLVFNQFQKSDYSPPVRSPLNRALVTDLVVSDFVLEARAQSTARDYGHRDLCLFFGYQDPKHLYYVHLGKAADAHAHSIFLVNEAPRVSIAEERTSGINWDDAWHTVRRRAGLGREGGAKELRCFRPSRRGAMNEVSVVIAIAAVAAIGVVFVRVVEIERRLAALGRIEAKLDALLEHAGVTFDLYANVPLPQDVLEALERGEKIEAIKRYRAATGVGLREAKEFVEDLQRERLRGT
jgi:hypothetical protein